MPELPDVEGFKRVLAKNALRKTIARVEVSDARILGNLGHFARDFREMFGELPSETLLRTRRHS